MVDIELDLEIEGTIDSEELDMRLQILGELIINEVKIMIRSMDLIGKKHGGAFLQGWLVPVVKDGRLTIENTTEYAVYLEYGTYGYWQKHGLDTFTDPMDPKKKDMKAKDRKKYPKGMQAFAPVRKVVFNQIIMQRLVNEAFT